MDPAPTRLPALPPGLPGVAAGRSGTRRPGADAGVRPGLGRHRRRCRQCRPPSAPSARGSALRSLSVHGARRRGAGRRAGRGSLGRPRPSKRAQAAGGRRRNPRHHRGEVRRSRQRRPPSSRDRYAQARFGKQADPVLAVAGGPRLRRGTQAVAGGNAIGAHARCGSARPWHALPGHSDQQRHAGVGRGGRGRSAARGHRPAGADDSRGRVNHHRLRRRLP